MKKFGFILALFVTLLFAQSSLANESVRAAYQLGLELIKINKTPPPIAAFILAQASQAASQAATDTMATSTTGTEAPDCYKVAFAKTLDLYFTNNHDQVESFISNSVSLKSNSTAFMHAAQLAKKQFQKSSTELERAKSEPYIHSGTWTPTPPLFLEPLLPGFGLLTPSLGVQEYKLINNLAPHSVTSSQFHQETLDTYFIGGETSTMRTQEQTEIAHFWAGGPGTVTPPGMWTRYALSAARRTDLNFADSARLMLTVSNALMDAAILCWKMKYKYDVLRPITAINLAVDASWKPLLTTPPFPAFTSGHSTFSAVAASLLDTLTPVKNFVLLSSEGHKSRKFRNYQEAALEAGKSRIYGGIHYEMDNQAGLKLGRRLACYYLKETWGKKCL